MNYKTLLKDLVDNLPSCDNCPNKATLLDEHIPDTNGCGRNDHYYCDQCGNPGGYMEDLPYSVALRAAQEALGIVPLHRNWMVEQWASYISSFLGKEEMQFLADILEDEVDCFLFGWYLVQNSNPSAKENEKQG